MQIVDVPTDLIVAPEWNANEPDQSMRLRLKNSMIRFGLVVPLVVRPLPGGRYETIGGAQRLAVLLEMGFTAAPCLVVNLNDTEARLLSQCLNRIAGEDNLGLRAQLMKEVLERLPSSEVLSLLPETASSLQALSAIGEVSISQALQQWQQDRQSQARLRHLAFQLTDAQLQVVEEALQHLFTLAATEEGNPNRRGVALYLLCLSYLERANSVEPTTQQEEQP